MMKVSILVAVYNGEAFIGKCLRSLLSQTYKDIEIVCIDDASTDGSREIIAGYQNEDSRIRLVCNDMNMGPARARNRGMELCTGDIIGYLDCDDWYADYTVERLVKVFQEHQDADCVLYRCIYADVNGNERDYNGLKFMSLSGDDAFMESLTWNIHGVYAARAELFRQYPYDVTCRHFSDDNTTRIHYYKSRRVYQSDAPYFYLYNPESISNRVSVSRMDYLAATESMKRQLMAMGCPEEIMSLYEDERLKVVVDCYLFYYRNRQSLSADERAYCLGEIRKAWGGIDAHLLKEPTCRKFGYRLFKGKWFLFRLQEELYFFLKRLTGRI